VVEDAQKIVRFIRARHVPLALFHKHAAIHAKGLSLLSPGATRFATNVCQDLVRYAEETCTDASMGAEEVDTRR
jgi:hypothetical protein